MNLDPNAGYWKWKMSPKVFHIMYSKGGAIQDCRSPSLFHLSSTSMELSLVHIGSSPKDADALCRLTDSYLKKSAAFTQRHAQSFRSESQLFDWLARQQGRTSPVTVLLDSRGKQMTSEDLAAWVRERRDEGTQHLVFAIGPADGWSSDALRKAQLKLSFGAMTMAHSLARLVMAEQIYRISTILTGHPYHTGH